jgi:ParB family transcriptional regulator, chromosome partitioning protein
MEVAAKRRALGRGLGALIPGAFETEQRHTSNLVPMASIQPNAKQPRQAFSEESIRELAESIKQKGILQPLVVREVDGGFQLIAGERRYRAAQELGLEQVPVTIRQADDGEALEMALIENIQREDLNPLEEARAYRRLIDDFQHTQENVATRVGKSRSTVANTLRLLQLPDAIKRDIERGVLSAGHARALVTIDSDAAKLALSQEVVTQRLSVRQTERLAKQAVRPLADADLHAAEQQLTEALGTKVRISHRRNASGRIEIDYYSLAELNGLIARLSASRIP